MLNAPYMEPEFSEDKTYRTSYEQKMLSWKEAAFEEAVRVQRMNHEYDRVPEYIQCLEGVFWDRRRPRYLSNFVDNRLAHARYSTLSLLTDIRPTIDVTSTVDAFKQQAMIAQGVIQSEWVRRDLDLSLAAVIDGSMLFGNAFWKMTANTPGEMNFYPCGPDVVMPINPGYKLQDSAAILFRTYKPLSYFQRIWPTRCYGLERESTSMPQHEGTSVSKPPHLCLSPRSLVQGSDGRIIPISQFALDGKTISSDGLPTKGRIRLSQRNNEPTVELKTWGTFGFLSTTMDHKVLTPDGFVEAQRLNVGDFVRRPVRRITDKQSTIKFTSYSSGPKPKPTSMKVKVNYDWGWLFGLYLAEGTVLEHNGYSGNARYGRIGFSMDRDEEATFAHGIRRALGMHTNVVFNRNKKSRSSVALVGWGALARFINEHFGRTDEKRVPDWAWECGKDFCKGIVAGYIEGDGHLYPGSNAVTATSTRAAIVVQMRELIASLGCGWSKIDFRAAGVYYDRNCADSYILRTNSTCGLALRKLLGWPCYDKPTAANNTNSDHFWQYSACGGYMDVKVEDKQTGFSEEFYDLEVDSKLHDFLTLQGTVKNSEFTWNVLSPQMRYRLGIKGSKIQGPNAKSGPVIELQEYWLEDSSINTSRETVVVKDPYLGMDEHNYHYSVPPMGRLFPRKRLIVYAGNRLMYDGPSPYWHGLFPFSMLRLNPVMWSFWGLSKYRDQLPLNKAINEIGAGTMDACKRALNPQMIIQDNVINKTDVEQFFPNMPGGKLRVTNQGTAAAAIRYMDPPILPAYVFGFLAQYLLPESDRMAGIMDTAKLMGKGQVPGGETVEQLRDNANPAIRLEGRYIEEFLKETGRVAISNIFQFYTKHQRLKILGGDGLTWEDFDYNPESMMVPDGEEREHHWRKFSMEVSPGSFISSKNQEKQIAIKLFQIGGISRREMLRKLDIGNIDEIEQEVLKERMEGIGVDTLEGPGGADLRTPRMTRSSRNGGSF